MKDIILDHTLLTKTFVPVPAGMACLAGILAGIFIVLRVKNWRKNTMFPVKYDIFNCS